VAINDGMFKGPSRFGFKYAQSLSGRRLRRPIARPRWRFCIAWNAHWPPEFSVGRRWLCWLAPLPCRSGPVAVRASVRLADPGPASDNEPGLGSPMQHLARAFLASEAFSA